MLSRAYPGVPKRVRPTLIDLHQRASTRRRYDPNDSYRVKASNELDEAVSFYSYIYGVAPGDIAKLLGVTGGAIRKRIARTPVPEIDSVDIDKYVDAPYRDREVDAYYRMLASRSPIGRRRFLVDYIYGKGLIDYSTNPDPDMPVYETVQDVLRAPDDSEFYVSDIVYKYLIGEIA